MKSSDFVLCKLIKQKPVEGFHSLKIDFGAPEASVCCRDDIFSSFKELPDRGFYRASMICPLFEL